MAIQQWVDNDAGYDDWVKTHPAGFLANTGNPPSGGYFRIHLATCSLPDRSSPGSVNPRTGNKYMKVTADTVDELAGWGAAHVPDLGDLGPDNYCKVCDPPVAHAGNLADDFSDGLAVPAFAAVGGALPEEVSAVGLVEGAVRCITVNAYERNPKARLLCIAFHGTTCCICGFRFGAVYGSVAEGYIHVHHVRPLSEVGGEYVVDPVEDLRPVCPNCHAVLHLGGQCRTIDEVRQLLG